jgi:D-arabinose 1-dehydrogenase-like Zn-dependent alcohol dehydrogenase
MWLAVRGAGLTRQNAAGKRVLIHSAAGGLGTLALQMMSVWGASVTAIARPPDFATCREAGAIEVVDSSEPFATLSRTFDATLNFAAWEDDRALICATARLATPPRCIRCSQISTSSAGCAVF